MSSRFTEILPSNASVNKTMDKLCKELENAKSAPGVNVTGRLIIDDTEKLIKDSTVLFMDKNKGEKFQQIVKEGHKASKDIKEQAVKVKGANKETVAAVDVDALRILAEKILETSRLAGMELISSASFRRTLRNFIKFSYDLVQVSVIDKSELPPPLHHRQKKKRHDQDDDSFPGALEDRKDKEKIHPEFRKKKEKVKEKEKEKLKEKKEKVKEKKKEKKKKHSVSPAFSSEFEEEEEEGKIPRTRKEKKENLIADARDTLEGTINVGLQKLGTRQRVKLSDDQLDEFLKRFMAIVKDISQRERSKRVFLGVLDMFKMASAQLSEDRGEAKDTAAQSLSELKYNKHVRRTLALSKELFEQFTGNATLDPLLDHISAIRFAFLKDNEAREYFTDLREYFKQMIDNPKLLEQPDSYEEGRGFIKRGKELFLKDEDLRLHFRGCLDALEAILRGIQDDPQTRKLKQDMKKLINDVAMDEKGDFVLKENVLQQLRTIVVYSIVERLKIPLPTIHIQDKDVEFKLRDMVLRVRDLIPGKVIVEDLGRLEVDLTDPKHPDLETATNVIRFWIKNVQVHMKNVAIWFKRTSFPRIEDTGRAKVDIGGKGIDITVSLFTRVGAEDFFRVNYVDCDVHEIHIALSDTKHDFMYNAVAKVMQGRIKRALEQSIENTWRNYLETLNRMLKKQVDRAKNVTKDKWKISKPGVAHSLTRGATALLGV